jgi:hypothetical protein
VPHICRFENGAHLPDKCCHPEDGDRTPSLNCDAPCLEPPWLDQQSNANCDRYQRDPEDNLAVSFQADHATACEVYPVEQRRDGQYNQANNSSQQGTLGVDV